MTGPTEKKKKMQQSSAQAIAYKYEVPVTEFFAYLPHDRSNSGP